VNSPSNLQRKPPVLALVLVWAAVTLSGCLQNYGRLQSSPDVTTDFKKYAVSDDYTYYYFGWAGAPDAIIGIRQGIRIESDRWKPVDFTKVSMQHLVDRVGNRDPVSRNGAYIVDPKGERIGIWFSGTPTSSVTVKMAGPDRIAYIAFPTTSGRDVFGMDR
jgi:hypothetical protein